MNNIRRNILMSTKLISLRRCQERQVSIVELLQLLEVVHFTKGIHFLVIINNSLVLRRFLKLLTLQPLFPDSMICSEEAVSSHSGAIPQ